MRTGTLMAYKHILLTVLLSLLANALAQDKPCGNHDIKVEYFRNCAEPKVQNIKITNLTYVLTDECKMVPRGCFKIRKTIKAAKVEYNISKPPLKKKGTEDFCKMLESPEAQKGAENYKSVPKKCTIPAGDYCINKGSTSVEQLNPNTLNFLVGTTTGYFKVINEGSGDTGCVEFKVVISKKK